MNCNSFFKVLDVYQKEGVTQIFLIHIPFKGIDFFNKVVLKIGEEDIEKEIIIKSRASLGQKLKVDIPPVLNQQEWIDRTSFPIGLDYNNIFFSLIPSEPLHPKAEQLYSAIKKMTEDLTELNEIPKQ